MTLSPHFSWREVERSATAAERGIANRVPQSLEAAIGRTAQMLECVRALLGVPLVVTSWYRSPELNRAVGSREGSMHTMGLAVDFVPRGLELAQAAERIAASTLPYDQLIVERARDGAAWIHLGLAPERARRDLLLAEGERGAMRYTRLLAG